MKKIVLAIGAHPDDIEIGCGGTIGKHILKGDKVYYTIATNGEMGGDNGIRVQEATEAAKMMGVNDIYFMGLPDTFVVHDGKSVTILDNIMHDKQPNIVYVHSLKDLHQDHNSIAKAVLSASRKMRNSIFCYEAPSTTLDFVPTAFNDISETFEIKMNCLGCFKSQEKKDYLEREALVSLSKFRGKTIGAEHAEAFEVLRLIEW